MLLMLGLATGAVVAAFYILHWRRGLIFPGCSMMAAILFALIPLRNAVPGNPPIGSIIDFGSFFIAEAVISMSLISSIVLGFRHQRSIERAESALAEEIPSDDAATAAAERPLGLRHGGLHDRQLTGKPCRQPYFGERRQHGSVTSCGSFTVMLSVSTEMLSWST